MTLIAGLRLRGLTAARTFDGPINAALFEDWVETCLVPTLSPGEIVVMDNLPAHKGPRVEQLIKAVGAQLRYPPALHSPGHEPDRKSLLQAQGLPAQNRRTDRRWSAARPRNLRRNLQALGMYKLLQILRLSGRYRMIGFRSKAMAMKPESRLTDQQRFDWLRLFRSENVGPRTFRALVTNCGGARAALKALPDLARRGGAARPIRVAAAEDIERELVAARKLGVRFVALGEPDYPPLLRQIDSAPPILALRGRAEALRTAAVAIVGSRNASAAGLTFAERLARGLGQAGYVVVSGLARGIDQRAHVASLETGAVGVLAGGHGKPYPPEAVPLMERMVEAGAVVSEMPIEWEPRGRDFPRRNRIVSGLALGTVVVEAARGSGSLITARFALEQNRQVFAVPGSPLDPRAEGTNDLLKQGASICTGADDVLTALEPMRSSDLGAMRETGGETSEPLWGEQSLFGVDPESTPRTRAGDEFDDAGGAAYQSGDDAEAARERIIALLGPSPITLDELARAAEAPARAVRVALLELELAGRIEFSGDRVALRASADER